jgi:cell division protein FtsQ
MNAAAATLPRRLRFLRPKLLAAMAAVLVVLGGGWMWLRDSSLVAVRRITIVGVRGADASALRSALVAAARNMTTLDVNLGQLHMAVQPYAEVRALHVSTQFPHGLRIDVVEQIPVGAVTVAGRRIAVAADGTLLHDVAGATSLPEIPLGVPPGGRRLTERSAMDAVAVLSAAPWQFLGRVSQVTHQAGHGVVAQLRTGPAIFFGGRDRLAAKWGAAIAVLADPGSAGAVYIDVTDPQHPVAGAGGSTASASGSSATASTSPAGPSTSPAGTTTSTAPAGISASG